jgi:hypothetical protein
MRISHIYAPLMLMELLLSRSPAPAEDVALRNLGSRRLHAFREKRGEEVFAHRSRHRTPISGSVKYRVHLCARGRCGCCGTHENQRTLEVDHIIPKNKGGSDAISTCRRCASPWWRWFIRYIGDEISLRESHAIGQQRRIELQAPD